MKQLLLLLGGLALTTAAASSVELSHAKQNDRPVWCMENANINSKTPDIYSFPAEPAIHLKNCTIDFFSPEVAAKLSDATTELSILDGFALKVYVKPTLTSCTILRCGTETVVIDPEDNLNLELLDIAGVLRTIPDNVQHLKHLAVLDLCENQIEHVSLDQLCGLERLRKVNLGHNKIKSVSLTDKLSLPGLAELFLHGNELARLDFTQLNAQNLQRFYVSQNQLTHIDGFPERFGKLTRADLFQNKWRCTWLVNTLQWLDRSNVDTLSFLPASACNETGTVRVHAVGCEEN